MQLNNYADFEPFKNLRTQMQANKDGIFELFDKHKHLTGEQRAKLEQGIRLDFSAIISMHDNTLRYKNSRIMLFTPFDPHHYHLSLCNTLTKLQTSDEDSPLLAFTPTESNLIPCLIAVNAKPNFVNSAANNMDNSAKTIEPNLTTQSPPTWQLTKQHLAVCKFCLQKLHFKGFDMYNNRHYAYSEQLWQNFEPKQFSEDYKIYPLSSNTY